MSDLFEKLGVNWKLLLAQAVNFVLLLIVLRFALYKPLLALLAERRRRIKKGLRDAEEAEKRLHEAEAVRREKLREGEAQSLVLMRATEEKAKAVEAELLELAHKKEADIIQKAKERGEGVIREEREKFYGEASDLLRNAVVALVGVKRDVVEDELLKETVKKLKSV